MKKDEILEKYRKSKEDEGEQFISNRSKMYGVFGFTTMFILITIFNRINNIDNDIAQILFLAYLSAEAFGKYTICKRKSYLFLTIAGTCVCILHFMSYILVTVGVWR